MRGSRRSRGRLGARNGQALAEFVLVIPVLLLLVFGIVEFGLAFRVHQIVTNSAREGARVAVLPSTDSDDVEAVVQQRMVSSGLGFDANNLSLSCWDEDGNEVDADDICEQAGDLSRVELQHPYTFFVLGGLVRWVCGDGCGAGYGTIQLRTASSMRNE